MVNGPHLFLADMIRKSFDFEPRSPHVECRLLNEWVSHVDCF